MSKWVRWSLAHADQMKNGFYEKLLSEGKIKPENMQPNVEPYAFYRDAFIELCTCKEANESSIPFTSIVEYFNIYGEHEDFEDFIYVIRSMDNAMIEASAKKKEAKNGTRNPSPKNRR